MKMMKELSEFSMYEWDDSVFFFFFFQSEKYTRKIKIYEIVYLCCVMYTWRKLNFLFEGNFERKNFHALEFLCLEIQNNGPKKQLHICFREQNSNQQLDDRCPIATRHAKD